MGKIVNNRQRLYVERIKPFRAVIETILKREQSLLQAARASAGAEGAAFKRLDLARDMLDLSSNYIIMSGLSQSLLKTRNAEYLDDARKAIYKSLSYLEEIVGRQVDAPFSDYEDRLQDIRGLSPGDRYRFICKAGFAVQLLENAFGDNSKWKWVFVELEGRFAAAAKNILDLKAAYNNTDPRSPDYEPLMKHLRLVKKLLMQAGDRYRDRYELSTNSIDDFKRGLMFLSALRRVHAIMGERDRVEVVKKKIDTWNAKLAGDLRKQPSPPPGGPASP
jgi:hypothetical protein